MKKLHLFAFVSFLFASTADAFWSDELTSHKWDATALGNGGTPYSSGGFDCGPDNWNAGGNIPGKLAGGWFERRFASMSTDANYFQSITGDKGKFCPKTFNEFSFNHLHGVVSTRLATYSNQVFAVHDSVAGYYSANKIRVMRDPSTTTFYSGTASRRYSILDLARNPRGQMEMNPGDPNFTTTPDVDCNVSNPTAADFDPQWATHTGADHEKTKCGVKADLQTFDPDIDIHPASPSAPAAAFVVWLERYVESRVLDTATNVYKNTLSGLPPEPNGAPERPLAVHVQKLDPNDMAQKYDEPGSRVQSVPLSAGESGWNVHVAEHYSAVNPRVAALDQGGAALKPAVAWVETPFSDLGYNQQTMARVYGPSSYTLPIIVAIGNGVDNTWSRKGTDADIGNACRPGIVSSGRATGRKWLFTGTHDIAAMRYPTTTSSEQPIVVAVTQVPGTPTECEVRVKVYNGTSWIALGGDLKTAAGAYPSSPRIVVHENVPYIVWAENIASGTYARVKKYRADTGIWEEIGAGQWGVSVDKQHLVSPSIAVTSVNAVPTPADDGAVVYVAASVNEPVGSAYWNMDGSAGVYAVSVSRCTVGKSAAGAFNCLEAPRPYNEPKHIFSSGVSLYNRNNVLGYTSGERFLGTAGNPPTTQTTALVADADWARRAEGVTDLVAGIGRQDGEPSVLFASWLGPVQDHRDFDRGVYVKRDAASPAQAQLVAAGSTFTLTYPGSGTKIYGWGSNAYGQLGVPSPASTYLPVSVDLGEEVVKVVANAYTSGALTKSGRIFLWGRNTAGQVCNGTVTTATTPQLVSGTAKYTDLALGDTHAVAVRNDGTVWTCGSNAYSNLGNRGTANASAWQQVQQASGNLVDVVSVAAGSFHSCALKIDRSGYCWGRNTNGQTGGGDSNNNINYARAVSGGHRFVSLALGEAHTVAVTVDRYGLGWGLNTSGQLGSGDYVQRTTPAYALLDDEWMLGSVSPQLVAVASAKSSFFFDPLSGHYQAAGWNQSGELGVDSSLQYTATPITVELGTNYARLISSSGSFHVYASAHTGLDRSVLANFCWGENSSGQCGLPGVGNQIMAPRPTYNATRPGCAPGVTQFEYHRSSDGREAWGCGGSVSYANRATLCASGKPVCSASEWSRRANRAPSNSYWVEGLRYITGSTSCTAANTSIPFSQDSGASTPVRVCKPGVGTGASTDAFGNTCAISNCGLYPSSQPDTGYFGGRSTNTTAGAMCCVDPPSESFWYTMSASTTLSLTTAQNAYLADQAIAVDFSLFSDGDLIALAPQSSTPSTMWQWQTVSSSAGSAVFMRPPTNGTYVARGFHAGATTPYITSLPFTVTSASASLSTPDTHFDAGATVTVSYSGLQTAALGIIRIAPPASALETSVADVYLSTAGLADGTVSVAGLANGTYVARALNLAGALEAQSAPFQVSSSQIVTDAPHYWGATPVTVSWTGIGFEPGDYVALASAGDALGFESAMSAPVDLDSNTVTFVQDGIFTQLNEGSFVARYMRANEDGSYTLKAETAPFSVGQVHQAQVFTNSFNFALGEEILVTLSNTSICYNSKVAIMPMDAIVPYDYVAYHSLHASISGVIFQGIPEGFYTATFFDCAGTAVASSNPFTVGEDPPPAPAIDVTVGEVLTVSYPHTTQGLLDHVAISPVGADATTYATCDGDDGANCVHALSTQAHSIAVATGTVVVSPASLSFAHVAVGTYVARFFRAGDPTPVVESAPFVVTDIGIQTDLPVYNEGQSIAITWNGITWEDGDYVVVANTGVALGLESSTYEYVSSATTASATFTAGLPYNTFPNADFPRGKYEVRYLRYDAALGYTLKARSAPFLIGSEYAPTATATIEGNNVRIDVQNTPVSQASYVGILPAKYANVDSWNYVAYAYVGQTYRYKIFENLPPGSYVARVYDTDSTALVSTAPFTIGTAVPAAVLPTKSTFSTIEPVVVQFPGLTQGMNDYVGINTVGDPDTEYTSCNDSNNVYQQASCYLLLGSYAQSGVGAYAYETLSPTALAFNGLAVGTYEARYYEDGAVVQRSAPFTVLALPAVPTAVTATAANAKVTVAWTGSAPSYTVWRSTTSGGPYTNVATVSTTSFVNTGLTNGTTYYYVVRATNAAGSSANSVQVSGNPMAPAAAPTLLTATPGAAQIALSWTAATGAASYTILRSTTSGTGYTQIASGVTTTSYTNTGLTNGTAYYYVVQSVNVGGTSGNSLEAGMKPGTTKRLTTASFTNASTLGSNVSDATCATANKSCRAVNASVTDAWHPTTAPSAWLSACFGSTCAGATAYAVQTVKVTLTAATCAASQLVVSLSADGTTFSGTTYPLPTCANATRRTYYVQVPATLAKAVKVTASSAANTSLDIYDVQVFTN